jgi:hypothetical protein
MRFLRPSNFAITSRSAPIRNDLRQEWHRHPIRHPMNQSPNYRSALSNGLALVVLAAAVACSGPAYAHHSFATYDRSQTLTLKGTVKSFQWTNPHCVVWIMVQPEGGGEPQEWSIETTSPGVLTRGGWTRNSIKPGDPVNVEYYPLRDGSHGGGLRSVTLTDTGQKLSASFGDSEKPGIK